MLPSRPPPDHRRDIHRRWPRGNRNGPSKVLLIVNEQDVTQQATVTPQGITYTPTGALAAGTYTVYLEIGNTTNASANSVWGFDVEEAQAPTRSPSRTRRPRRPSTPACCG